MSDEQLDYTGAAPKALLLALRRMLKPLVRMLMHFGIGYPYLTELLKSVFVEVAEQAFPPPDGKKQTDSRVNLLTGVHRKDVRRLRHDEPERSLPSRNVSLGAQLVACWLSDPDYVDSAGNPRPLQRFAKGADDASFETLVEMVGRGDIRAAVVLDELLRLDIVTNQNDVISLKTSAFIPQQSLEDKAFFFGKNLHDHTAAVCDNLIAAQSQQLSPFIDRCVYYDGLTDASVSELRTLSEELAMQMLKAVNKRAHELQHSDHDHKDAVQRMNLGVYFYHQIDEGQRDD
jgi:hypothetical protein